MKNDWKKCENCGECVERCQFGAREEVDGKIKFNKDNCFGCCLCLETCPANAIEMLERKDET